MSDEIVHEISRKDWEQSARANAACLKARSFSIEEIWRDGTTWCNTSILPEEIVTYLEGIPRGYKLGSVSVAASCVTVRLVPYESEAEE